MRFCGDTIRSVPLQTMDEILYLAKMNEWFELHINIAMNLDLELMVMHIF
jgi:hypothetical protein